MKLAKCPYCGRRLSYLTAQQHKKKGEYLCSRCKKESNVYISYRAKEDARPQKVYPQA